MHKAAREQIRPMRYGCQLVTGVWRGYVCTWLSPKARGSYGTPNTLILCVFMYECVMLMARRRRRALAPRARRAVRGVYSCTVEYCTKRVCPVYTVQYLCAYILNACALWQHLTLSGHDSNKHLRREGEALSRAALSRPRNAVPYALSDPTRVYRSNVKS